MLRDILDFKDVSTSITNITNKVTNIEQKVTKIETSVDEKVSKTGDTMSGILGLNTTNSSESYIKLSKDDNNDIGFIKLDNESLILKNIKSTAAISINNDGSTTITASNLKTNEKEVVAAINSINTKYDSIVGPDGTINSGIDVLDDDTDINNALNKDIIAENGKYDMLVDDSILYSVKSYNSILKAIENKKAIPDVNILSTLERMLFYPNNNKKRYKRGDIIIKNKKLARITNTGDIKKIYSVSHGFIIQTFDNRVFIRGYNGKGLYGNGTTSSDTKWHQALIPQKPIKKLCASNCGSIMILYEDGEIYSWGTNNYGACGIGVDGDAPSPVKLNFPKDIEIIDMDINGTNDGTEASVILLKDGSIYVCGYTSHGIGLGAELSTNVTTLFKKIKPVIFDGNPIKCKVGWHNDAIAIYIITDTGKIYSAGHNEHGELLIGVSDNTIHHEFKLCTGIPDSAFVLDIYTGAAQHVIRTKTDIYVQADNYYGSLGLGHEVSCIKPASEIISHPFFTINNFKEAYPNIYTNSRNWYPYIIWLMNDGSVYGSGYGTYYSISVHSDALHYTHPWKLIGFENVRSISTCWDAVFALRYSGDIICRGCNENSELGEFNAKNIKSAYQIVDVISEIKLNTYENEYIDIENIENIEDERLQYL